MNNNVSGITPSGVKDTGISTKSKNKKINRSNLPPSQQPFSPIQIDLKEIVPKKKFSLTDLNLSEKSCQALIKFVQTSQVGQEFSPFENLVQFFHCQMGLLEKGIQSFFPTEGDKLFKEFKKIGYNCLYSACFTIPSKTLGAQDYSEKNFSTLFDVLKILQDKVLAIETVHQPSQKNQEKINKLKKDKILVPISEIKQTFECIQELNSSLSEDQLASLITIPASEIAGCGPALLGNGCTLKETVTSFKQSLLNIQEANGRKMDLLMEYADGADQLLKLMDAASMNEGKVLEQYLVLSKTWERLVGSSILLIRWMIASSDKKLEVENEIKVSGLPIGWIQEANLVNLAFFDMFISHFRAVRKEMAKTTQFRFSETGLIDLNIVWRKLCHLTNENAFLSAASSVNDFSQSLKAFVKNKKIDDCLEKIPVIIKALQDNNGMVCLENFIQSDQSMLSFSILKDKTVKIKEEAVHFEKLMKSCNAAIQGELNKSQFSDEKVKNLKELILKFRTEMSHCLSPILSLPAVLDTLIYNGKRRKIFADTYQPLLEDEIKNFFNVKFREPILVEKNEKKIESDRPQTNETAVIMGYLKEKGWVQVRNKSSHLMLKKDNETLTVPISKSNDHLDRGTLGAIYRQLAVKEEKIAARKST